jgi:hypothetical protein
MESKWMKRIGAAVLVGAVSVTAFASIASAQNPTPTTPSTNTTPSQNTQPWGMFGQGGMKGRGGMDFGGRGFGPERGMRGNSFFAAAATAFGMTAQDLYTQLQAGKTLADIAKEKNVDTAKLVSDYVQTFKDSLATAVSQGQITQAQADAMAALHKTNAEAMLTKKFDATTFGGRGIGFGPEMGMRGNSFFAAAATAFGMTAQDLYTQLQAGKTLADIAKEKNVDTAKLVSDYVKTYADALKTAVTNNQLTQAQADAKLAELKANAEALLTKKFDATGFGMFGPRGGFDQPGMGGFGGHGGRGGHGGMWGPQPQQQQQQQGTPQAN